MNDDFCDSILRVFWLCLSPWLLGRDETFCIWRNYLLLWLWLCDLGFFLLGSQRFDGYLKSAGVFDWCLLQHKGADIEVELIVFLFFLVYEWLLD